MNGAAQPVAAATAINSSTAGPRGSKGTALKVTKRFSGENPNFLSGRYCISWASLPHSRPFGCPRPRQGNPTLAPSHCPPQAPAKCWFCDTLVSFVLSFGNDHLLTQSKIISVGPSWALLLISAFLAKRVRYLQSSTSCPRVIECFRPCLVFFLPFPDFWDGVGAIRCSVGWSSEFFLEQKIQNLFFPLAWFS